MQRSRDPVAALPLDVLYNAFWYLKPFVGLHDHADAIKPRPPQILTLGHISRSWRAVTFSFPLLWDSVYLVLPHRKTKVLAELLQEWMERSGQCRLFISLSCSVSHHVGRSEVILQVLLNHSHRWYNVTFDLPMAFLHAFDEGNYNFPVLDSISLGHLSASDGIDERETPKFLDKAPNIRVLRVVGVGLTDPDHSKEFPQLTHFEAEDITSEEVRVLLDRAPNLRYLAIESHVPLVDGPTPPRDGKSQLRVIKARSHTTFQLFQIIPNAPSLRYLTVDSKTLPLRTLLQFMKRNTFQHLHTLGFATEAYVHPPDLSEVLSMADSVVTFFFLSFRENDRKFLRRTLPDILNPGQPHMPEGSQQQPKVILPRLENLYYVTACPIQTTNMKDMIKRRWNGYDKGEGSGTSTENRMWAKLRSVYFGSSKRPSKVVGDLEVEISEGLEVHYGGAYYNLTGVGTRCDSVLDHEAALL